MEIDEKILEWLKVGDSSLALVVLMLSQMYADYLEHWDYLDTFNWGKDPETLEEWLKDWSKCEIPDWLKWEVVAK